MKKIFLGRIAAALVISVSLSACSSEPQAQSAKEGIVYSDASGTDFKGNTGDVALEAGDTYAVISVEKFGDIKVKLFPEAAPYGVQNFIDLANNGYFTGKSIHRVISDFMLQGGSLNGDGTGGEAADGGEFYCEINSNMRHFYGALCYANAGGRNTCQFYIVNNKTPQTEVEKFYEDSITSYVEYRDMFSEEIKKVSEGDYYYAYFSMQIESLENSIKGWEFIKGKDDGSAESKYAEVGGTPSLDGCYTVFGQTVEGFDVIDAISAVEVKENASGEVSSPVEEILISSVTIHTV